MTTAVLVIGLVRHMPVILGLDGAEEPLLVLTLLLSTIAFANGVTNILQGAIHQGDESAPGQQDHHQGGHQGVSGTAQGEHRPQMETVEDLGSRPWRSRPVWRKPPLRPGTHFGPTT